MGGLQQYAEKDTIYKPSRCWSKPCSSSHFFQGSLAKDEVDNQGWNSCCNARDCGHFHFGHIHWHHHLPHSLHSHSGHPRSKHKNGGNNGDSHELFHSYDHSNHV